MRIGILAAMLAAVVVSSSARAVEPGPLAGGQVDRSGRWIFVDPVSRTLLPQAPRGLVMPRAVRDGIPGPSLRPLPGDAGLVDTSDLIQLTVVTRDRDGHVEAVCRDAHHFHPLRLQPLPERGR